VGVNLGPHRKRQLRRTLQYRYKQKQRSFLLRLFDEIQLKVLQQTKLNQLTIENTSFLFIVNALGLKITIMLGNGAGFLLRPNFSLPLMNLVVCLW
jgi:polysaccharide pyruvyl transferase WcaK-like protein